MSERCPVHRLAGCSCEAMRSAPCHHQWLDRPESDDRVCLVCGDEVSG